ncbi:carbohydrate ABC transporter permease [Occultella gossypii]|uniref:Sugar ABC transporter permease n=1 Tax=Occultella gossypii TaxID=2800820 RepID=A0ABS7SBX6_9MICO|nr:sugar ABC transporter permease [Occultella gossypii]MBZ2197866.1 sugar ABC transporter permease [Occultella gossypii]
MTTVVREARAGKRMKRGGFRSALPYLAPALVLYGAFLVYPILDAIRLSFFSWDGFKLSEQIFVGLDNYIRVFTKDPVFGTAFTNTIIWTALSVVVPTTLGLGLAIALNRPMRGRGVLRSIFYVSNVLAPIAVATVWKWIYNPTVGLLNQVLEAVGLGSWAQNWLGTPSFALYSVFVAFVWQVAGFNMVLYLAGLQSVPTELVDAARVDGANRWQVFRAVTLPSLRPTTLVVLVLTIIHALKVFDLIVGMTGGGPAQSTQVLALWSYTQSFGNHNFGQGNALATILLLVTLLIVVPYMLWNMRSLRGGGR